MQVLKRIVLLLLAAPAAVLLITLAVANRHSVLLVLDPFRPQAPTIALSMPFYIYLLSALILGVMLGGLATWMSQGRFRRLARLRGVEARRWHAEADRLARERDNDVAARGAARLAGPKRSAA